MAVIAAGHAPGLCGVCVEQPQQATEERDHGTEWRLDLSLKELLSAWWNQKGPPEEIETTYAEATPDFDEVCAPTNPGGLTLARQVFWQSRAFPEQFAHTRHILPNAQHWAWRLSGVAATEITSLGAQTHLWAPKANDYSSLVDREGWRPLFPPMRKAGDVLGPITAEGATATGLPADTPVLCGIHDSNANYLRYLATGMTDFTLMSAGTWVISFNAAQPLHALDPARDTASNTDVYGNPVACSRFIGGREFDILAGDPGVSSRRRRVLA